MNEWICIVLAMISQGFLHYFPWSKFLKGKVLPRPVAYALGVLGLMAPFTLWILELKQVEPIEIAIMLWKVIIGGGFMVLALYGLDRYIELEWRDMESAEREDAKK